MEQAFPIAKQNEKPMNRNMFILSHGITLDSMFPSGNIGSACRSYQNPYTYEIKGNPDYKDDCNSRYWLYFRMKGYRKGITINFILKDANHLRKFYNCDRGNRPNIVFKLPGKGWEVLDSQLEIQFVDQNRINAAFEFYLLTDEHVMRRGEIPDNRSDAQTMTSFRQKAREVQEIYIAINYPYSEEDLEKYLRRTQENYQEKNSNLKALFDTNLKELQGRAYYNEQTLIHSFERRRVPFITLTSCSNIASFEEREPRIHQNLFPNLHERPFKLKKAPVIIFTGRVHPSEVSASFFMEGVIDFLLEDNPVSQLLRETFIFLFVPMINTDGVSNGNYRHDNALRNMNRFYGKSTFQQTPQIKAIQCIVDHYRGISAAQGETIKLESEGFELKKSTSTNQIQFYFDVHGHQSSKSSFLFGNFTENVEHMIQNKVICKLVEKNFIKSWFKSSECDFSKRNMTVKEKYDQNSKMHSGRAYTGTQFENKTGQPQTVFHSYTLEISPFCPSYKKNKFQQSIKIYQIEGEEREQSQISSLPDYCKCLAQSLLQSIPQIIGLTQSAEQQKAIFEIRASCFREATQELTKLKNLSANIRKYEKLISDLKGAYKMFQLNHVDFLSKLYYESILADQNFKEGLLGAGFAKGTSLWKFLNQTNKQKQQRKSKQKLKRSSVRNNTTEICFGEEEFKSKEEHRKHRRNRRTLVNTGQASDKSLEVNTHWNSIKKLVSDEVKEFTPEVYQNQLLAKIREGRAQKVPQVNIGDHQFRDQSPKNEKPEIIHANKDKLQRINQRFKTDFCEIFNEKAKTSFVLPQQKTGSDKRVFKLNRIVTEPKEKLDAIAEDYSKEQFKHQNHNNNDRFQMYKNEGKSSKNSNYSNKEVYKPRNSIGDRHRPKFTIQVQERNSHFDDSSSKSIGRARHLPVLKVHQTPNTFIRREVENRIRYGQIDPSNRKSGMQQTYQYFEHSNQIGSKKQRSSIIRIKRFQEQPNRVQKSVRKSENSRNSRSDSHHNKEFNYLKTAKELLKNKRMEMFEADERVESSAKGNEKQGRVSYPHVFKIESIKHFADGSLKKFKAQ